MTEDTDTDHEPTDRALTDIDGVGPIIADALRDAGFESAGEVARADPEDLAAADHIGESRAEDLIETVRDEVDVAPAEQGATADEARTDDAPAGDPVGVTVVEDSHLVVTTADGEAVVAGAPENPTDVVEDDLAEFDVTHVVPTRVADDPLRSDRWSDLREAAGATVVAPPDLNLLNRRDPIDWFVGGAQSADGIETTDGSVTLDAGGAAVTVVPTSQTGVAVVYDDGERTRTVSTSFERPGSRDAATLKEETGEEYDESDAVVAERLSEHLFGEMVGCEALAVTDELGHLGERHFDRAGSEGTTMYGPIQGRSRFGFRLDGDGVDHVQRRHGIEQGTERPDRLVDAVDAGDGEDRETENGRETAR